MHLFIINIRATAIDSGSLCMHVTEEYRVLYLDILVLGELGALGLLLQEPAGVPVLQARPLLYPPPWRK
jgi:hypothetical protein